MALYSKIAIFSIIMIFNTLSSILGKNAAMIISALIYFLMLNLIVAFSFFGAGQFRYANW